MLETLFTDLRDATRTFLRMPGFTLVAVLTLALGIGINTTVFTVINAVLFKGYPFVDENERVLYVERPGVGFSYREFEDWRARATSFEGMAAATAWLVNFGDATGVPERTAVTVMGPEGFRLIGQKPFIGRDFLPSDGAPGAEPVAIVSHALWARRYGVDPGVIGRTVKLDASGVGTSERHRHCDRRHGCDVRSLPPGSRRLHVCVRAEPRTACNSKDGIRRPALDPELTASFATVGDKMGRQYRDRGLLGALLTIFAAVGLSMASVGVYALVAHLVSQRTQEIGVRTAMGATTGDIWRLVFAYGARIIGAGLAIGLAASLIVNQLIESQLVRVSPFDLTTCLVACAVLAMAAAIGCLVPARRAMRVDPIVALRHE